jgi:hypothetical protein
MAAAFAKAETGLPCTASVRRIGPFKTLHIIAQFPDGRTAKGGATAEPLITADVIHEAVRRVCMDAARIRHDGRAVR